MSLTGEALREEGEWRFGTPWVRREAQFTAVPGPWPLTPLRSYVWNWKTTRQRKVLPGSMRMCVYGSGQTVVEMDQKWSLESG